MSMSKINVFLVDDHQVLLDGLQSMLGNTPDITIVGAARNGVHLLEKLKKMENPSSPPAVDVVLMDIDMPVMNGLEATEKVKFRYPGIKVIMLTMLNQMEDLKKAEKKGADGFLSKHTGKEEITEAIRKVHRNGEFVIKADLDKPAASIASMTTQVSDERHLLTEREKQIISLICKEYNLEDIASSLSLSGHSVVTQRKSILSKLGVKTNIGIVRKAMKLNLCSQR